MMQYTWDTFKEDCRKLSYKVSSFNFTHILAIERGGVFVANEVNKYYDVPIVKTRISFYNGQEKRKEPIIDNKPCFSSNSKVLILDDLADSGSTLKVAKDLLSCESQVATMIYKNTSIIKPDFYIHTDVNSYVDFPWEGKDWN